MKILLLNQCFWPDVVATAQQSTALALELAARGHEVTVMCARRGYDNADLHFSKRERWNEIEIIRLPSIGLGKTGRWRRGLNFASFSMSAALRLTMIQAQDAVIALTSPPLISSLASLFTRTKGGRLIFWVMDLNPDEAIAAGWLKQKSLLTKLLAAISESSMRHSERIIALDRFMKERIVAKGISDEKIEVISPATDDAVNYDETGREAFRLRHGLAGKFVVMYAGNHSPCHPLDTLIGAARRLKARDDIAFVFVGGGSEQSKVKEFAETNQLKNIHCLPYQPQAQLAAMLSAGDLQVVIMGEALRGIVHPSKIYNILAIGSPFLYIGPTPSHVTDIISNLPEQRQASSAQPGAVGAVVKSICQSSESWFSKRGAVARFASRPGSTLPQFIALIESAGPETIAQVNALCQKPDRQGGLAGQPSPP